MAAIRFLSRTDSELDQVKQSLLQRARELREIEERNQPQPVEGRKPWRRTPIDDSEVPF